MKTKLRSIGQSLSNLAVIQFVKRYKKTIAILIMIAFFAFFGLYIYQHPKILDNVIGIGLNNTALIFILYGGVVLTNVSIIYATIRLCRKKLSLRNSVFLTMYSNVINFFGPLQSGPAVRAVYLKKKIGLLIRDYMYVMLFYYFSFAAMNVSLLFITKMPWLSVIGIVTAVMLILIGTSKLGFESLKKYVFYIFISTIIQIVFMIFIYSIELNAINPAAHYSLIQTISYTASANLALFVSLTPGAIGIREAFLILSQSLHNIPLNSIVAAGIVDRAIYIVFLISLFILSSGMHLKRMFTRDRNILR